MKRIVLYLLLTFVLIALFSYFDYRPEEKQIGGGYGPKHKGDSGLILPGDGESLANIMIEPEMIPELSEEQAVVSKMEITTEATVSKTESVATSKEIKEEHKKVNEWMIGLWHGVAAVLIGEASALMVAFAWMKIRGGK